MFFISIFWFAELLRFTDEFSLELIDFDKLLAADRLALEF